MTSSWSIFNQLSWFVYFFLVPDTIQLCMDLTTYSFMSCLNLTCWNLINKMVICQHFNRCLKFKGAGLQYYWLKCTCCILGNIVSHKYIEQLTEMVLPSIQYCVKLQTLNNSQPVPIYIEAANSSCFHLCAYKSLLCNCNVCFTLISFLNAPALIPEMSSSCTP